MPSNAKQFARELRQIADEYPKEVFMPRFRRIAFKLLEVAVQNTPVNTGRLRGGWHVTEGTPSGAEVQAGTTEQGVLSAAQAVINKAEFGTGLWIQNNVPYAIVYEEGLFTPPNPGPSKATHVPKSRRSTVEGTVLISGGYHVSAPEGMLADAIQQVSTEIQAGAL